jgi:hypothetical protein
MTVFFVHRDGRLEAAKDPVDLQRIGGLQAHPAETIATLADHTRDLDVEIWATWHMNQTPPPPHGRVVLLVVGDETGQIPVHTREHLCVFSNGSRRLGRLPKIRSASALWAAALEMGRMARNFARRLARRWRSGAPLFRPPNLHAWPLGAAEIAPVTAAETVVFGKRAWDVAFLGSIGRLHRWFGRDIALSPKAHTRLTAVRALARAKRQRPDTNILVGCADQPRFGEPLEPAAYRQAMAQTKIALCPRGNFVETFRHAEAARCGSVVFTDAVPEEWYFQDHPFVVVGDWSKVAETAARLVASGEAEGIGAATQEWYEQRCSPPAVADFMARRIRAALAAKGDRPRESASTA